ncbi:MAG: sulfotransferase [Phycisphaerales bacterium]|nr:sulfotransferase [Phycisphaerales bacterium]
MTSDGRDIILTGLPRSGTTLTVVLLNQLPHTVALHEPMIPGKFADSASPGAFVERVADYYRAQRASIASHGTATSKSTDGIIRPNSFADPIAGDASPRRSLPRLGDVAVKPGLPDDHRLVIKQNAMFTARLEALEARFPCYAIVRNPLSVILSWRSIKSPVHDGRSPAAEAFDPEVRAALASEPDRDVRQVWLLRWFFEQYLRRNSTFRVIRYEDIVESGGRALAPIDPDAASLAEPLRSRNRSDFYDARDVDRIADLLIETPGAHLHFYPADAIDSLRRGWEKG